MSFILEALRRAERERNNAAQPAELRIVSDGSGAHVASGRMPPLPWIIGGFVAAFALGALLIVLLLRPSKTDQTPSTDIASAQPAATEPAATAANEDGAGDPSDPKRLDDLVDPEAGFSDQQQPVQAYAQPQQMLSPTLVQPHAPQEMPPPDMQQAAQQVAQAPEPPPQVQPMQVQQMQLDAAPPPEARPLQEMPPDYRAGFPQISLDVVFYDEDAARRFIMINGKRYREGDTLQEGPRVTQIMESGVVMNHRGQDVLLPASH